MIVSRADTLARTSSPDRQERSHSFMVVGSGWLVRWAAYLLALVMVVAAAPFAVLAGAPADAIAIEAAIGALRPELNDRMAGEEWPGAMAVIEKMATIDPEHNRVFVGIAILNLRGGLQDDVAVVMARFGRPAGPGQTYGAAVVAHMRQDLASALQQAMRAFALYDKAGHPAGQAAATTVIGMVHEQRGQFEKALAAFEPIPALQTELDNDRDRAQSLGNLARLERQIGRFSAAVRHQQEILAIHEQLGNREGEGTSRQEIGRLYLDTGDTTEAEKTFLQALEINRELGNRHAQISTLGMLARAAAREPDLEAARAWLAEGVEVSSGVTDASARARLLWQIGDQYREVDLHREAIATLRVAVAIFEELGAAVTAASVQSSIGDTLRQLGEYVEARELLEPALAVAEQGGDERAEANLLTALGTVHLDTGRLGEALVAQERALEIRRRTEDRRGELVNLMNTGVVYHRLGESRQARGLVEAARDLATRLGDHAARAMAYNNLGAMLHEDGALPAARSEYSAALDIWTTLADRRHAVLAHANLASVDLAQNDLDEAANSIDKALSLARAVDNPRGEAMALNLRGKLQRRREQYAEARASHQLALARARAAGIAGEEWRALDGLGLTLDLQGHHDEARGYGLQALDRIEATRREIASDSFRVGYVADKMQVYEHTLRLALAGGPPTPENAAETLQIAERARARGLLDLFAESSAGLLEGISPELLRSEEKALAHLNRATVRLATATDASTRDAAGVELQDARKALNLLEETIRRQAPRYGEIVYPMPATAQEVQDTLARGEVLLEYFLGEQASWLWTVDRARVTVQTLPPAREISPLVNNLLEAVASRVAGLDGGRRLERASRALAKLLLPDAGTAGAKRLILVPDGSLHLVPFGLLPIENGLLIESHEVAMVPSASTLRMIRSRTTTPATRFLGIGGVLGTDDGALPLPHARAEIESIAKLLAATGADTLIGAGAGKAALRTRDLTPYRFIHFATHGWLDDADRRNSGLRLTPAPDDPSSALLTLDEIPGLRLSTDLVVLSACESALGEQLAGEGLLSLTRAFLYAGSRAVAVSLWNVSDASTGDLMTAFYRGMLAGEAPATALRQAQLGFLRSDRAARRQARLWAPFVLVGDPGQLVDEVNQEPTRATVEPRP